MFCMICWHSQFRDPTFNTQQSFTTVSKLKLIRTLVGILGAVKRLEVFGLVLVRNSVRLDIDGGAIGAGP